jgi:acyl carrier protein
MTPSTRDRVIAATVCAAHLSPDQALDHTTPLVGSGISLDSIAVLELVVGLEREFAIELDPDEMFRAGALGTIGTLADFIDSKLKGPRDAQ